MDFQTYQFCTCSNQLGLFQRTAKRKTSLELIDEALQRGELTTEIALIYRVYVLFQDERLPGQYHGDDADLGHFPALSDAAEAFPTLSIGAQNLLRPFFIPPAYVGSWAEHYQKQGAQSVGEPAGPAKIPPITQIPGWASEDGPRVRLWYRTQPPGMLTSPSPGRVVSDCEYIWTQLESLLGVTPISDRTNAPNGGDGRLDIYVFADPGNKLIRATAEGQTQGWVDSVGHLGPRFILIRTQKLSRCLLAHEMTHAFLAAMPVSGNNIRPYLWLNEATATWAQDFVYRTNNCEHEDAAEFLKVPDRIELPLDEDSPEILQYGHYVFPFFMDHFAGGPPAIATMWRNCKDHDALTAIDAALPPGGLKTWWPPFALLNLN